MGLKILPVFEGYTIDTRLKEFRKIEYNKIPEFIPFKSAKGDEILVRLIRKLNTDKPEDNELFNEICRSL